MPGWKRSGSGLPSASTPNVCAVRSGRNANDCRMSPSSNHSRDSNGATGPQYGWPSWSA